jgi:hypothetical protein
MSLESLLARWVATRQAQSMTDLVKNIRSKLDPQELAFDSKKRIAIFSRLARDIASRLRCRSSLQS